MIQRPVAVRSHHHQLDIALLRRRHDLVSRQSHFHRGLAVESATANLLGQIVETHHLDPLLSLEILTQPQPHHIRIGLESRHLRRRLDHVQQKKPRPAHPCLILRRRQQSPGRIAEIQGNQQSFHRAIITPSPARSQREIAG